MAQICLKIGQWFLLDTMPVTILECQDDRYILGANNGQHYFYSKKELENLYSMGRISSELSKNTNLKDETKVKVIQKGLDLKDEVWEEVKYKRLLLQEIDGLPWNEKIINCAIDKFYKKYPQCTLRRRSFITVYRWSNKYKKHDSDITALLDESGRGKWDRYPAATIAICNKAIEEIYLNRIKGTVTQTLRIAKAWVIQENQSRPSSVEQLRLPSRKLIDRLIKAIPAYERDASRLGPNIARNMHRGTNGIKKEIKFRELGELDATPINVVILDDFTHAILGRGWITVLKEVTSQYPLGVYIGYTPPSCLTLAECLKHSLLPKNNLRTEFPNIENEWIGYGPVERIKVDNAFENHSKLSDSIVTILNIDITYCGRATPWQKPNIESYLGYVAADCMHKIPGTTFHNIFEKGDYDSEECAVMTFSDFKGHIMKWFVDVYMQKQQKSLHNLCPHNLWKHLNESQGPIFETRALNLDMILGRVYQRQVNNKGIAWEGLAYASQDLTNLRMKYGHSFETTIRINELDISNIWVKIPNSDHDYIKVPAINQEYTRNLSAYLHGVNKAWAQKHGYQEDDQGWMLASANIYEMVRGIPQKKNKVSAKNAARILSQLDLKELNKKTPNPPPAKGESAPKLPIYFDLGSEIDIEDFEIVIKDN